MANNFFTLKIEVISINNDGWLREHYKEHVVASYEIRLPDINKEPFDKDGYLVLPLPDKLDHKKMGLTPNPNVLQDKQALFYVRVVDMTRLDSMIVYNPNREITEDRPWVHDYAIK